MIILQQKKTALKLDEKFKSSNFGNWPVAVEFIMETVVRVKETSRYTTRIRSSHNNQLKEKKNTQVH